MNSQKILVAVAGVVLVVAGYRAWGWGGVALAVSGVVMYLLLQFTRALQVLRRATNRPIGYVDSAVMLNAKLKNGQTLLHVVALTKALGALQTPKDEQPEVFRWTDSTDSHVTCEFRLGKLASWTLFRPDTSAAESAPPAP